MQLLGQARNSFAQTGLLAAIFIALALGWEAVVAILADGVRHVVVKPVFGVLFAGLFAAILAWLAMLIFAESTRAA